MRGGDMKIKVVVEQRHVGVVVAEVPDEKWEKHTYPYVRRKLIKQAAAKALADGADVEWWEPSPIEATTGCCLIEE